MGLDQYSFKIKKGYITQDVDFEVEQDDTIEPIKPMYKWRKHPNLQGWMERLYREKNGAMKSFNCTNIRLTWEDLERLEKDVKENKLPHTTGSFFGSDADEFYKEFTLEFIEDSLQAIAEGYDIFYSSWW